ncbi:hypothetical protein HRO21_003741 [Vibrio parahaemolyticus]|nr:hypothetical protein [Vibrio parahaemolyticus]
MSEIFDVLFSYFGGVTVILVSLSTFLGHISTKRIISRELAAQNIVLENVKTDNQMRLQHQKELHGLELRHMQEKHERDMELIKAKLKEEFIKFEAYTSISKEKYQDLFEQRIEVYESLLELKKEIDSYVYENAEFLEVHDDDPTAFMSAIRQINEATQNHPMVISNKLAKLSDELYEKSMAVFTDAKVKAFYAEMENFDHKQVAEFVMNAENDALRELFVDCRDVYSNWFLQLDSDLTKIRGILDLSGNFLWRED